ncbi:MAG TPA: redoxin domain-containing protein [bacterium]|nr:redoxin domain-containing protein [bacterium]
MREGYSHNIILGLVSTVVFLASATFISGQPAIVRQEMPDFTLPVYQGGEINLSQLRGKTVLLIFPRGLAGKDHWCHICNYQYADLAILEKEKNLRERFDLEILFVLPYDQEMVQEWVDKFSDQVADIQNWKNPADPDELDEREKRRMEFAKKYFPKNYAFEKGKVPLPFPVLIDVEQKISKSLGLYTTEWGGSKIEQNIPTIYVIDKTGVLQFKYHSQNTLDRPPTEYLVEVIYILNREKN